MNRKLEMGFLMNREEELAGGAGIADVAPVDGGATTAPSSNDIYDGGDGGDDGGGEGEGQQTTATTPPADPQVPLSTLREIMSMQQQQAPAPAAPAPTPLTQEQIDEQLKVYRANTALAQRFFGEEAGDEHVELLNELIAGITDHVTTVMGYGNQYVMNQLTEKFSPALDMVQRQQMDGFKSNIETAYPALKGQGKLIEQTIQSLRAQGYQPADGNEAARMVAGQVEALIKTVNPQFSLTQAPQQTQGQQTTMPSMAGSNGGVGGGAAGAAGGGKKKQPAFNSIWD